MSPTQGLPANGSSTPLPACGQANVVTPYRAYSDWQRTLLDTTYRVPATYSPPDLVPTGLPGAGSVRNVVRPDLLELAAAAAEAGAPIEVQSAFRSYGMQVSTFNHWVSEVGRSNALSVSARPGHSEHQLGTAIDFTSLDGNPPWDYADWATTKPGAWLAANAWRYGFISSYPRSSSPGKTCYAYEPWHYRYVGRATAAGIHESGLTPREYLWDELTRGDRPAGPLGMATSYVLDTSIDYDRGTISTTETATVTNRAPASVPVLDFSVLAAAFPGEFALSGTPVVNGKLVQARWTNTANFELPLDPPLTENETATTVLRFVDTPGPNLDDDLDARLAKANGILQASDWFPILSTGHGIVRPGDSEATAAATSIRFQVTLNRSMPLAAPGTMVSASGNRFVYVLANARDYTFAVSPGYSVATDSSGGIPVRVYYTSGTGPSALRSATRALAWYGSQLGPYAYNTLVLAQSPRADVADEWSGIVTIGEKDMASELDVAHEVAHQWWYGAVGVDQIETPWLDEGFAEFSSRYFLGYPVTYASDRPVRCPATCWTSWWKGPNSYGQTVYYKSASMLNALRMAMGNRAFFGALREIQRRYRFGILTTAGAAGTFEQFAPDRAAVDSIFRAYGAVG